MHTVGMQQAGGRQGALEREPMGETETDRQTHLELAHVTAGLAGLDPTGRAAGRRCGPSRRPSGEGRPLPPGAWSFPAFTS